MLLVKRIDIFPLQKVMDSGIISQSFLLVHSPVSFLHKFNAALMRPKLEDEKMYVLKFALTDTNEDLAVELKKQLSNDCDINIVKSVGLLGSTEVIVAIVAAAPGIITTIASVIKNYFERNSNKSLTIKIGSEEHTYKGYSMNEIKEIEELFSTSGRDLPDENGSH